MRGHFRGLLYTKMDKCDRCEPQKWPLYAVGMNIARMLSPVWQSTLVDLNY
jgi:hypothetical protein